jgi:hypothetical protein
MDFTSAFISMQQGHKVTRTTWSGYWCIKNGEIIMVTREGKAVNLRESPDMMYTISNMLCTDWGVCDDRVVSMLPGESITDASKVDAKNVRNDAKVNKHEEQKKKPEYTYNINNPNVKKSDINNDKNVSKDETPKFLHPDVEKAWKDTKKRYKAVVIDENGNKHNVDFDNIPELMHSISDDGTLEAFLKWLGM